jgi:hypothetical protein
MDRAFLMLGRPSIIMNFVMLILAIFVFLPLVIRGVNRRRTLLAWGLPRAVEIAKDQGWVSPHLLMTQADLKNSDAQYILYKACKRGLLNQAVNGRYYVPGAVF